MNLSVGMVGHFLTNHHASWSYEDYRISIVEEGKKKKEKGWKCIVLERRLVALDH